MFDSKRKIIDLDNEINDMKRLDEFGEIPLLKVYDSIITIEFDILKFPDGLYSKMLNDFFKFCTKNNVEINIESMLNF